MDIKYIYDYLNELSKCVWYNNAIENGIRYNNIDISQGTEYYRRFVIFYARERGTDAVGTLCKRTTSDAPSIIC